jgi:hypothetical protein
LSGRRNRRVAGLLNARLPELKLNEVGDPRERGECGGCCRRC